MLQVATLIPENSPSINANPPFPLAWPLCLLDVALGSTFIETRTY
jgi:hypothetical protein